MRNPVNAAILEAYAYNDRAAFISALALSSIWGDAPEDDIPADRIEVLGQSYDGLSGGIRAVCSAFGITQTAFASRFGIPPRTVSDWCRDLRTPPPYVVTMAIEILAWERIRKD